MKQLIISCLIVTLLFASATLKAQTGPEAGDISVALKFGKAISFSDIKYFEVNSGAGQSSGVLPALQSPEMGFRSEFNDFTNMIGVEGKYFVTNNIAARLSAGGAMQSQAAGDFVEGVNDPENLNYPGTVVHAYPMQEGYNKKQFYLDLGADYYFSVASPRVHPYGGVQFNSAYANLEIYDGYRGLDGNGEVRPPRDTRKGEAFAWGGSLIAGVDYYLAEGFFLGIEIKALNYMYAGKKVYPQTGVAPQTVNNHNTLFLSQPVLKIGFSF